MFARLSVASAVVAGLLHVQRLSLVLPLAITAALLAARPVRHRVLRAQCERAPHGLGYVMGAAVVLDLVATLGFLDQHKLSWGRSVGLPYSDTYLHLAIAREIFERGPVGWPTVINEPLGYHWFTHAWVAQITGAGHLGVDVTLLRILPFVAPLVVTSAIAGAALRLTGSWRPAAIAVAAGTIGGVASMVGAGSGYAVIYPYSPTVGMSVPPLLAAVTVIGMRWRRELPGWSSLVVFGLAVVATGSKGSTTPVLLAGLAVVVVLALFLDRSVARTAALDALAVALAIGCCLVAVFHGPPTR